MDTDADLLQWMTRTGQIVSEHGRLVLWRRYHDSIYSETIIRRIAEMCDRLGIERRAW